MPTFRKKWSFPAAKVRMRSRSAGGMSSAATCGASVLMRSADAARFRLWHSSPIWTAWAIRLRMSTPPIRRSTSPSAGPRTASNHRSRSIDVGREGAVAERLPEPLVQRGVAPVAGGPVLHHEDRHPGRRDPGHRSDRRVMVAGIERERPGRGEALGLLRRLGEALVEERADDRAPHRPAHPRPRRAGARRGGRSSASCPARPRARGARRPGRAGPRRAAGAPRDWRRRPRPARAPRPCRRPAGASPRG